MRSKRIRAVIAVLALGLITAPAALAQGNAGSADSLLTVGARVSQSAGAPPSSTRCRAVTGGLVQGCYGPSDLQSQYNFGPLYAAGDNGAGQTIVIFDSFGSPTIRQDLQTFDSAYGLPAPPSFDIYQPEGKVNYNYTGLPAKAANNKNFASQIGWAYETTLDVEWAHAMAPGANIALVETPNAETEGVQGLTNLENAQRWALANHIGTIWSNSFATTEEAFHTPASILQLNALYAQAASEGVTAFFATGDSGVLNQDLQGRNYPFPTVTFPSSSPDVVSVGGTQITTPPLSISGYQSESAWNDCCGSGNGGYSSVFGEPSYQSAAGIADPLGMRGTPDVSYNSALLSSVLIWESFDPSGSGWIILGGTSAAAPQWAALDAVISQADGPLGFLNPRLYQVYENPTLYAEAFNDVTSGNNSWGGLTGFAAGTGWDPATGLGTPNAAGLAAALTHTTP